MLLPSPCSLGFFTAKGSLVSSIMYPQPTNFRFYQDAAKFLLILGLVGKTTVETGLCLFWRMSEWRFVRNNNPPSSFFSFHWDHLQLRDPVQSQCKRSSQRSDPFHLWWNKKNKQTKRWLLSLRLRQGDMEGADHQNPGRRNHRRAGGFTCRHHHRHHLRPASSEAQRHLLHQPAAHQHQRQGLRLLLRQGEWGGRERGPWPLTLWQNWDLLGRNVSFKPMFLLRWVHFKNVVTVRGVTVLKKITVRRVHRFWRHGSGHFRCSNETMQNHLLI